ncbi:MAG: hypothetical protein JO100_17270 [Pseudonocardia sp.]|nr:hypothetical protein [Pseudonocardia sp.]
MSPFVAGAVLLPRASSWLGNGSLGGSLFGNGSARPAAHVVPMVDSGWLSGISEGISQFWAWLFLLIALSVIWGVVRFVVEEIKLRRMYDRIKRRRTKLPDHHPPPG